MTYTASDFALTKSGPQFLWLDSRLTLHGFPPVRLMHNLKDRVQAFQLKQGWTGTGADGLVGPQTLLRLTANPGPTPAPSSILQLSKFKRTLPTGDTDHPTELYPLEDTAGPVIFRAPVDGVTTSGSSYPRDELREVLPTKAWSNRAETHRMVGVSVVTMLPGGKRELTFAQVHDADDDVVMLLVSGDRVYASWSLGKDQGSERVLLFSGYQMGSPLNWEIVASPAGVAVSVNGYKSSKSKLIDGAYNKAGCYLQANESNGTGYGEVVIYKLEVSVA
jgi:hypothetical protein